MHSAAIFVFVSVDSNHFRYVRDFEVVVQGLVGDVQYQGALLIILSIFDWNVWRILVLEMACCIPIALSCMSGWVAVLSYIRLVCCVYVRLTLVRGLLI